MAKRSTRKVNKQPGVCYAPAIETWEEDPVEMASYGDPPPSTTWRGAAAGVAAVHLMLGGFLIVAPTPFRIAAAIGYVIILLMSVQSGQRPLPEIRDELRRTAIGVTIILAVLGASYLAAHYLLDTAALVTLTSGGIGAVLTFTAASTLTDSVTLWRKRPVTGGA